MMPNNKKIQFLKLKDIECIIDKTTPFSTIAAYDSGDEEIDPADTDRFADWYVIGIKACIGSTDSEETVPFLEIRVSDKVVAIHLPDWADLDLDEFNYTEEM